MGRRSTGVTLAQVARIAGVSDITASRVLRAAGPVSDKTRERVLEAVRNTGYVHNRLAGALASARSNLVGVILPSLSNNVFPEVMAGIGDAMARSGYQPVVGVADYDLAREQSLVRSMLAWQPSAMIIAGLEHTRETIRMLDGAGIRIIEIMDVDERPIDLAIGLSHREAGRAAARHLIGRGYRRFGYVGHDIGRDLRAASRRNGIVAALVEAGIEPPREVLIEEPSSVVLGEAALAQLLGQAPDLDIVVFSNDDMAVGGVFHCLRQGIEVPGRLALFGFNGLQIGQALPQRLSTIRSHRGRIGQLAMEAFLAEPKRPEERRVIDTGFEIIEGQTA